jgi:poly(3-hydroxybutyrate) depolymerase
MHSLLYHAYQSHADALAPLRLGAQHHSALLWWRDTEGSALRKASAALDVIARLRLTHSRPDWGIAQVEVDGRSEPVLEENVLALPFGTLLHFRKPGVGPQPRVLLVAPLSGHFATLLRETARTLLQDHDVYVTDWHNARDVHLRHGAFALDDYVDYLMRYLRVIGPGAHVVAVCQPCVAALAAAALMAEDEDPAEPRSLTLMAGPVDCRVNPTEVNHLASGRSIGWFEHNLISHVPAPHRGQMRRVYPGFVQLGAFLSMNPERHVQQFRALYQHLVDGEMEQAEIIRLFYEEYLAVNDLPAEFYLETVGKVFQTFDLARGALLWRGRPVRPEAIRRAWLMTVEGERDDICSVGQTVAAQDLCPGMRPYRKLHHVQTGVGHYGVFSGRRWKNEIYPRVREMIHGAEE